MTTLGRGGSDTTATVLAAALGAERCDIYTDVDGIYTTDPRVVPAATRIPHLTYREVLCLADSGAAVIHPRAVFHSKRAGSRSASFRA
ncbi:amino acid kinase family protein [Rossellomorea sp. H39__3]